MDEIRRGEVWWVDLTAEPRGSEPGFRRPVIVVQDDAFNRSAIATVLVVAVTKNLASAGVPGNVLLPKRDTGLKHDSVANVAAILTVDRAFFADPGFPLGRLPRRTLAAIEKGLALVLGL